MVVFRPHAQGEKQKIQRNEIHIRNYSRGRKTEKEKERKKKRERGTESIRAREVMLMKSEKRGAITKTSLNDGKLLERIIFSKDRFGSEENVHVKLILQIAYQSSIERGEETFYSYVHNHFLKYHSNVFVE